MLLLRVTDKLTAGVQFDVMRSVYVSICGLIGKVERYRHSVLSFQLYLAGELPGPEEDVSCSRLRWHDSVKKHTLPVFRRYNQDPKDSQQHKRFEIVRTFVCMLINEIVSGKVPFVQIFADSKVNSEPHYTYKSISGYTKSVSIDKVTK